MPVADNIVGVGLQAYLMALITKPAMRAVMARPGSSSTTTAVRPAVVGVARPAVASTARTAARTTAFGAARTSRVPVPSSSRFHNFIVIARSPEGDVAIQIKG